MKYKESISILIQLLLLLVMGALFVYKLSFPLSNFLFYSFVFFRFIVSKNVVFWTAFLFIILNNPWGLFFYRPYEWYFNITSTVGLSYMSMFGIVFLIKIIRIVKSRTIVIKDYFIRFYKPMGIFIFFLIVWSFAYGHNKVSIFNIIQYFPSFLLFYCVPRLLNKYELLRFDKIIFLFSLIHFTGSILEIVTSGSFLPILTFGKYATGITRSDELIRFIGGITIHLYVLILGLYYLSQSEKSLKNWYLWLLIISSYFFILNSATRGWMIASTFILLGYYIFNVFKRKSSIRTFASILLILIIGFIFIPKSIKNNLSSAFNRLETVEDLAKGDETAGGTLSRLTERGPRVLTRFWESPIVGFGYSKVTAKYYDPHVGNHCLLLMGGIVGLVVLWLIILFLALYLFKIDLRFPENGFFVFGLALLSIMIIHSSSRTMVSYYMPADAAFLIALFLNHINATFTFKQANLSNGNKIIY